MTVFTEHGLSGARMEDIASEAGISKGTLYLYFSGKEELFEEAIREKVARVLEGLASAAPPGEPVLRLTRFVEAYWAHLRRPQFGSLYRLILAELHQFPDLVRFYANEASGHTIGLLAGIIQDGVDEGRFHVEDPQVTARMIVGLLVQHAVWASHRELFPHLGRRTDKTLAKEMEDFILAALLNPGHAKRRGAR